MLSRKWIPLVRTSFGSQFTGTRPLIPEKAINMRLSALTVRRGRVGSSSSNDNQMKFRCVDKYPRLIASDNIPKVSLLVLAEDTKERSGALCQLIPQFKGQHMGDPSGVSRLHVPGYGKVS
jgi:hypothetical protein